MNVERKRTVLFFTLLFWVVILCFSFSSPFTLDIRPGSFVTRQQKLSDFLFALRDTPADTPVFILDSGKAGANVLLLGGSHGNEISGIMAAILFIERAKVVTGKLVVIPFANASAVTSRLEVLVQNNTLATAAEIPVWFEFETPSGKRTLPYGSRLTQPQHQLPDADSFFLGNGIALAGEEARNLNRVHPGNPQGTLTQKISAAIVNIIFQENIDMVHDFHESGTKSSLAYTLVCNPKNVEMGAYTVLELQSQGLQLNLEQSSEEFLGLSHREFGDRTAALAFLSETPNPGQDTDTLSVPDVVTDAKYPLYHRVAVQVTIVLTLLRLMKDFTTKEIIVELATVSAIEEIPSFEMLNSKKLYEYYR